MKSRTRTPRTNLSKWAGLCMIMLALSGCAGSPATSNRVAPPENAQVGGNWIQVQRGDTLGQLAQRANVPIERLQRFNPGVDASRLAVGQRLLMPTQQERAPSGGPYRYQIRAGDTYSGIARHFGTTSGRIQSANPGVSATALRIGQVISVPIGSASASASRASSAATASRNTAASAPSAPARSQSLPASARRWPWPLDDYRVVRSFGADSHGTLQPMLLATQTGARAKAVAAGEVRFASSMRQLGQVVIVHHPDNLQSVYALCERLLVKVGDNVTPGQELCVVGQNSDTQRHDLLFDLRQAGKPVDPRQVLR